MVLFIHFTTNCSFLTLSRESYSSYNISYGFRGNDIRCWFTSNCSSAAISVEDDLRTRACFLISAAILDKGGTVLNPSYASSNIARSNQHTQVLEPGIDNTEVAVELSTMTTLKAIVNSIHNVSSHVVINVSKVLMSDFVSLIANGRASSAACSGNFAANAMLIQVVCVLQSLVAAAIPAQGPTLSHNSLIDISSIVDASASDSIAPMTASSLITVSILSRSLSWGFQPIGSLLTAELLFLDASLCVHRTASMVPYIIRAKFSKIIIATVEYQDSNFGTAAVDGNVVEATSSIIVSMVDVRMINVELKASAPTPRPLILSIVPSPSQNQHSLHAACMRIGTSIQIRGFFHITIGAHITSQLKFVQVTNFVRREPTMCSMATQECILCFDPGIQFFPSLDQTAAGKGSSACSNYNTANRGLSNYCLAIGNMTIVFSNEHFHPTLQGHPISRRTNCQGYTLRSRICFGPVIFGLKVEKTTWVPRDGFSIELFVYSSASHGYCICYPFDTWQISKVFKLDNTSLSDVLLLLQCADHSAKNLKAPFCSVYPSPAELHILADFSYLTCVYISKLADKSEQSPGATYVIYIFSRYSIDIEHTIKEQRSDVAMVRGRCEQLANLQLDSMAATLASIVKPLPLVLLLSATGHVLSWDPFG